MNFEPIEIKIKEVKLITEIAYVIDRPTFIKEANKIRSKYKITAPLQNDNYQDWIMTRIGEKNIPKFYKDITDLRLSFGYDANYQTVFEKAILGCDIEDGDYQSTHLVNFTNLPPYLKYEKTIHFGIIVTPQTDKKDVIKAYERYKQIEKGLQTSSDSYSSTAERVDKRTEIERDRTWYWKSQNNVTYWQIAQTEGVNRGHFEDFYKDRIAKAIKSYKKKLGIE